MWGKTDLKEGLSLDEYNDYIETMRKTEYPMLQGWFHHQVAIIWDCSLTLQPRLDIS